MTGLVKEIVVLRETGVPLFHYSVDGQRKLDEIVSAFLSAIGSLVELHRDTHIREIAFAENKFVWESKGDLYFIALVSAEDSTEIYHAILYELADQFVSMFYPELMRDETSNKTFRSFTDVVESTLQRFDGIPGLARRYKTALLPHQEIQRLKSALARVEASEVVLRGAVMTSDGFILVSNLRSYELEIVNDLLPRLPHDESATNAPVLVMNTSLDPDSSLFIRIVNNTTICIFVVRSGSSMEEYNAVTEPFVYLLKTIDLSDIKRIEPVHTTEAVGLYDFDLILLNMPLEDAINRLRSFGTGLDGVVLSNAISILSAIDNTSTLAEVVKRTGLKREMVNEIIALMIARGIVRLAQLFPVVTEPDNRFMAYLEVIGMPKRDYAVIDAVWKYCTGESSIRQISLNTGIPASRIIEVLGALGRHVKWQTERVLSHTRTTER